MFESYIIYIENSEDLIKCQNILFEREIKWKKDKFPEIYHPDVPVYLFISRNEITWTDDRNIVWQSSYPKFSYKEYLKVCMI